MIRKGLSQAFVAMADQDPTYILQLRIRISFKYV